MGYSEFISCMVFELLPTANVVCAKVMFSQVSVILLTGGSCMVLFGGCAWFYAGGMCMVLCRGACVVLFGGHAWFYAGGMRGFIQGACVVLFGGCVWFYAGGACVVFFSVFSDTMRYGQLAGGTHPTGMHSCFALCREIKTLRHHREKEASQ